jgi:putative restriction endonuclease
MANAVFTTKINPVYDDLPEVRYHFPRAYYNQALETVGDWILYYEPRREGANLSGRSGRQCYFATARVETIEPDKNKAGHFYAYVSDYLEFPSPVPFRQGDIYYESGLRKSDGSTNKGRFGRALRKLPVEDYRLICQVGFASGHSSREQEMQLAEQPVEYGRTNRLQLLERPFRDAAFRRVIQQAYSKTCAMTGLKLVNGGGRCEIEAAHILPVEHEGPDSPRNGIALSRTVHWLFDRGILSISEKGEILEARGLVPDPIRRLLNPDRRILGPSDATLRPHPHFVRYHQEKIFKGA